MVLWARYCAIPTRHLECCRQLGTDARSKFFRTFSFIKFISEYFLRYHETTFQYFSGTVFPYIQAMSGLGMSLFSFQNSTGCLTFSQNNLLLKTVAFIAGKKIQQSKKNFIHFSIESLIANISFYALSWPKLNFGCYLTFEIIFKAIFLPAINATVFLALNEF